MDVPQRKHLFLPFQFLSVTVVNKLVSTEVNVCCHGHKVQQAGYQQSSELVAVGTLPQKHVFQNTSLYACTFRVQKF